MSLVTASKVGLLAFCQAFPKFEWDTRSGPAAERGTRFHQAIALYATSDVGIPIHVDEDIREEFARAREWFDSLGVKRGSASLHIEVAFAWDPMTDSAEILGRDRDYSKANGRLCGTADLVLVVMMDGKAVGVMVWDYKTGDGSSAGPQLRTLGLMAARAFGVDSATVAALEVRKTGVTEVAREELDAFALDAIAGELAEQLTAIETAQPTPGSHCGELYCPARLSCPLGAGATAELVPADALTALRRYSLTEPIETAEHAIWAVDVIRLVNARLDAIKDDIKAKCPKDGWAAEDGRVLRETMATIQAFDKHKALALCRQLGATDEQIASLNYTFEKSNGLRVSEPKRARKSRAA